MKLFDAHCHLQDERLAADFDAVMRRAAEAGVTRFMCCGTSEADWPQVRELADRYPGIHASFGLHPWFLDERGEDWQAVLAAFLETPGTCVGETGLDHALEPRRDDLQESVFLAQLGMARDLARPVSIHCRRAWGRMIELLEDFGPHKPGLVFHAFSGSAELVERLIPLGACVSFSGSITYSGNKRGHKAAAAVPGDRLLAETDSPDMAPPHPVIELKQDGRGKPVNEPANLLCVIRGLAEVRGLSEEEIAALTNDNATRVFQCEAKP